MAVSQSRTNELCRNVLRAIIVGACLVSAAVRADDVADAKAAIIGLYPELKGKDLHIAITDGGLLETPGPLSNFTMVVQHPSHEALPAGQCPIPVLSVYFTFAVSSTDHQLFLLGSGGTVVNEDRFKRITDQVDSHAEWSDADVLSALTKAGARFGPSAKKELLDQLPIKGLSVLMGDIDVESAEFKIRDASQIRAHLPSASLTWIVKVSTRSNNQKLAYLVMLEPFDGKVVYVTRFPPVMK
jgi:hypothetical protein